MGMLALSLYVVVDTFFVSLVLGAHGLAALNLAIPIVSFVNGAGLMLGMGAGTKYTIYRSQGLDQKAGSSLFHAIIGIILFGIIGLSIGMFGHGPLASLLGAKGDVFEMTSVYIKYIGLFAPAFMMNHFFICIVRNDGKPHLSMAAMITGSFSNIILDYIFMFSMKLGMFGAVIATCFAPIISILIMTPFLARNRSKFRLRVGRFSRELSLGIVSTGVPSMIAEVSSGIVMIVFNTITMELAGNLGVAAYGVIANLSIVVIAIFTGIAQGVQPLFSRSYGLGRREDLAKYAKYGTFTILGLSLLIYFITFIFADGITAIFNSGGNAQLQEIAVWGLKIYFIGCFFAGLNILAAVYYASTDCPRPAHIISILRGFALIIPLAIWMAKNWGLTGAWASFPAAEGLVCLVALIALLKIRFLEK